MNPIEALDKWPKSLSVAAGLTLIAVIGVLDYLTGYELSFSVFYLIPIFIFAWQAGKWLGLAGSLISTLAQSVANDLAGQTYLSPLYLYWNAVMRLALFAIVALVMSALKKWIETEKALARIDHVTGAANARSFLETLRAEIDRSRRYNRTFTLAYADLDNFKTVNDSFGHAAGDVALHTVVQTIRQHIRSTDVVARLGGDEFALLLPETDSPAAQIAIAKIQTSLQQAMSDKGWAVTVSIGSLTCINTRLGADDLIKQADALMYQIKMKGKNGVKFSLSAEP